MMICIEMFIHKTWTFAYLSNGSPHYTLTSSTSWHTEQITIGIKKKIFVSLFRGDVDIKIALSKDVYIFSSANIQILSDPSTQFTWNTTYGLLGLITGSIPCSCTGPVEKIVTQNLYQDSQADSH